MIIINKEGVKEKGIGFAGALALIFITLKLCHVITWSWLWVLSPIWLPAILVFGIFGIVVFIMAMGNK